MSPSLSPWRQVRRLAVASAVAALAISVTACRDDRSLTGIASSENTTRTFSVFAMSGTPAPLPTAYYFSNETLARPQLTSNGSVNFEVAFDITDNGRVALYPARVVVPDAPSGIVPPVGIQQSTTPFIGIEMAPDRNYVRDSTFTGAVGDSFVLQLLQSGCPFGEPVYGKIHIDSIIASERRIVLSSMVNRNCGFRSLAPGLPTR